MTFCAQRGQFGEGAVTYKLANQRPLFYVQDTPPHLTRDDLIAACLTAFSRWSEVCDMIFAPANDPNAAQFIISTHPFDGPLGILADCELPAPNLRPQALRLDPTEKWQIADNPAPGNLDLLAVLCHEMGHGIGLQHFDPSIPPPEIMNPIYNPAIVHPQSGETAFVQKLYGLPQTHTVPTPVPPIGDSLGMEVIITYQGHRFEAKGNAHLVQ
jgi:hypothetical protein